MACGDTSFESLVITRRNTSEVLVTWSCPDMVSTTSSKRRHSIHIFKTKRNYSCTVNQFKCSKKKPVKCRKKKHLEASEQMKHDICDKVREFNEDPYKMRDTVAKEVVGLVRSLYKLLKEILFFIGCYPCSDIVGAFKNIFISLKNLTITIAAILYRVCCKFKKAKKHIIKDGKKKKRKKKSKKNDDNLCCFLPF